jgi:hypothetical protein
LREHAVHVNAVDVTVAVVVDAVVTILWTRLASPAIVVRAVDGTIAVVVQAIGTVFGGQRG